MRKVEAEITEIFSSVQGEGIFVGAKQIFVRFRKCNMECAFCDEDRDAGHDVHTPESLMSRVASLESSRGVHHSVSLTGGEPLVYAGFLKEFLPLLRGARMKAYLETNGTLPDKLSGVIDQVDIVAMDFKLPSSTGGRPFWKEHSEFINIAMKKNVFVKAVVTSSTRAEDVARAVAIVNGAGKKIPFILQPATPVGPKEARISNEALLGFLEIGLKSGLDHIRVIPQVHKMMNLK
jgi:organic radical activating enzyme